MIILYVPHSQSNGVRVDMPEPRNVLGARRPELDFPMFQLCIKNIQPCGIVINGIDIHDAAAIAVGNPARSMMSKSRNSQSPHAGLGNPSGMSQSSGMRPV